LNPIAEPRPDEPSGIQAPGLEDLARRLPPERREPQADQVDLARSTRRSGTLLRRAQRVTPPRRSEARGAVRRQWLLDNYYLVQQVIRQVRQDMPPGFYRQLPVLAEAPQRRWAPFAGCETGAIATRQAARIYVLASS
jgi:cyclic beta-1,2-glucan synthetase